MGLKNCRIKQWLLILDYLSEMQQNFDDRLLKILEEEVLKEKWKKKIRITGTVTEKKITKRGSFMFAIKTERNEYDIIIPKYKTDEFELASGISKGDVIKVIGDRQISGLVFCDVIQMLSKMGINENQSQLELK